VKGDYRTYENVLALRAVTSTDGMTADWYPFPQDVLDGFPIASSTKSAVSIASCTM